MYSQWTTCAWNERSSSAVGRSPATQSNGTVLYLIQSNLHGYCLVFTKCGVIGPAWNASPGCRLVPLKAAVKDNCSWGELKIYCCFALLAPSRIQKKLREKCWKCLFWWHGLSHDHILWNNTTDLPCDLHDLYLKLGVQWQVHNNWYILRVVLVKLRPKSPP